MRRLRDGRAALFLPPYPVRKVEKQGPVLAVFKSYSEIAEQPDSAEQYWEKLNEVPLYEALSTLSAINLILAVVRSDSEAHAALNHTFVREDYLHKLAKLDRTGPQPDLEVVFSRAGILANLKALMAAGRNESKTQSLDLHLVGDLALLCNDYIGGTHLKTGAATVGDMELLIEFLPSWELENPRHVAYGLARVVRMIKHYLPGHDSQVVKHRGSIGLDPATLTYDGLGIDDYIAIVFVIYGHGQRLDLEAIFSNPGECIIDANTFFSKTKFPRQKLEHFLNERSQPLQWFRDQFAPGGAWDKPALVTAINSEQFATNTLPFKAYPFLQWGDGRTLVLDIQYVSELLIYGLYWRIVDDVRKNLGQQRAETFIGLWGRLFELYLFDLFYYFYPPASAMLSTDVGYKDGQIDALLDYGSDVFVFEFKASLLRDQTKNNRDIKLFEDEMALKFIENQKGAPKALRQLAGAASAICGGAVQTTVKPKRIYPVLVGYEPVLESFYVNAYLQRMFRTFIPGKVDDVVVQPLTVMSVDELEMLLPNIQAGTITWTEVLDARFDRDNVSALASVRQTLRDLCAAKGKEIEGNAFLLDEFNSVFRTISSKYFGEDNGGSELHPE